jgi:HlyD family secretion protein
MARGLNAPTRDSLKMLPLCAESDQLAVHTVGGVISNGETITQIVPRADDLVAEAKVASNDIDQVAVGRRRWCASHGRQLADHA